MDPPLHIVTGAFGDSGGYIARRLLEQGYTVRTLTNSPEREDPFGGRVAATPYRFDEPARLVESLPGAAVLYNTYWVRFNYGGFTLGRAEQEQSWPCPGNSGPPRLARRWESWPSSPSR